MSTRISILRSAVTLTNENGVELLSVTADEAIAAIIASENRKEGFERARKARMARGTRNAKKAFLTMDTATKSALLSTPNKTEAVRSYRSVTGCGLYEATCVMKLVARGAAVLAA